MLYDSQAANLLLGALMNDPTLFFNDKYKLKKDDFEPNRFHKILYVAAENVAKQGVEEITEVEVGSFMSAYPKQLEVLKDNNFVEFIPSVKKLAKSGNVEYYWNTVRKYSLLRSYEDAGFNVDEIYDSGNLAQYSLEQINNHFESKFLDIKQRFALNNGMQCMKAGDGFEDTKEAFKEDPYFGAMIQSPYQTTLYRGWCKGHLLLRSAPSGFGKTAIAVGDLCNICATEYWDEHKKCFIKNPNKEGAGLYINTELDLEKELTPIFVAWISNVDRSKIMDGKYEGDEEARVNRAIQILHESEIYLCDDPRFSLQSLEQTIKHHILKYNVETVVMDYIQDNGVVSKEMKKTHEVVARDTIVLNMADTFKTWAKIYNLRFLSMTQLNGNEKINDIIDEACLAGGKAIKNKLDAGSIIMFPRKKELAMTEIYGKKKGFEQLECNMVSHCYKTRFGKYGSNIKIFQHVALGTGRVIDLYCTNAVNEYIKVEKIMLKTN